jgi:hypothetical protein
MSVMGIVASIWMGFSLITVSIAIRQKLPVALWVFAALVLGPYSLFWVAAAIAKKRRLPSYDDGSTPYGGGGSISGGGFGP